jgi:hypothetical protein
MLLFGWGFEESKRLTFSWEVGPKLYENHGRLTSE